jgi:hypothetical protein
VSGDTDLDGFGKGKTIRVVDLGKKALLFGFPGTVSEDGLKVRGVSGPIPVLFFCLGHGWVLGIALFQRWCRGWRNARRGDVLETPDEGYRVG